jgi:hypothetical protein
MGKKSESILIRVDTETKRLFPAACKINGETMSDVIGRYIAQYIKDTFDQIKQEMGEDNGTRRDCR